MSAAEPHEPAAAVRMQLLKAQTLEEMAQERRRCDACHAETLYGCHAVLELGFTRWEICAACFEALAARAKELAP